MVVVCGDFVARACGVKMNSGILCGAEGGVEWTKDDGEKWRDKVREEEGLKDVGREL